VLRTIGGILTELSRVYRAAWSGKLEWQDAGHAARILRELRQTIEGDAIEQRIAALEALAMPEKRANGGGAARPWQ
jgi:hypothetical protein